MFDLKDIGLVLTQLEEEKGLSKETVLAAIEESLASAYKKEFGKRGQMIRARFDLDSGTVDYSQIKLVVDPEQVLEIEEGENMPDQDHLEEEDRKIRFNPELHLYVDNAKLIKAGAGVGDELVFPLESQTTFSRVAAMAAKQVLMQKIRGAEKEYLAEQFGTKVGQIVSGTVERVERGTIFVNMDKAEGLIQYNEQIRSERFKTGDRIRAYLFAVEDSGRGVFLKLSRTHPEFMRQLFEIEVPELNAGTVEIKRIAREPGARSKVAVWATDPDIDPIGSMVGQNGSRISTVTSELSGERIDIIEWSEDPEEFIESSMSPAKIADVILDEEEKTARVEVVEDQFSLAIGRGGQNVRLSAKLTGYKIDIVQIDAEGNEIVREERPRVDETTETEQKDNKESTDEAVEATEEITESTDETATKNNQETSPESEDQEEKDKS